MPSTVTLLRIWAAAAFALVPLGCSAGDFVALSIAELRGLGVPAQSALIRADIREELGRDLRSILSAIPEPAPEKLEWLRRETARTSKSIELTPQYWDVADSRVAILDFSRRKLTNALEGLDCVLSDDKMEALCWALVAHELLLLEENKSLSQLQDRFGVAWTKEATAAMKMLPFKISLIVGRILPHALVPVAEKVFDEKR